MILKEQRKAAEEAALARKGSQGGPGRLQGYPREGIPSKNGQKHHFFIGPRDEKIGESDAPPGAYQTLKT